MKAKNRIITRSQVEIPLQDEPCWYAIHTKPAREDCVVSNVSRMGLHAFNPKIRKKRKVWGTVKEMSVPLFPCYVFAKFNNLYLSSIKYVRGARRVVGVGEIPSPIDEHIIDAIRLRAMSKFDEDSTNHISPGDPVVINRGALYGLEGIFVEELSDKERVTILLETIEWQARIQVEKTAIEKSSVHAN
jgi:transcriptional antiterminator RfaH